VAKTTSGFNSDHTIRQYAPSDSYFATTYRFATIQNVTDDRQTTQCTKGTTKITVGQKPWPCFSHPVGPVFKLDHSIFVQIGQCLVEKVISRFLVHKIMFRILPRRPHLRSANFGPRFTRPHFTRAHRTDETNAGKSISSKYSRYMNASYSVILRHVSQRVSLIVVPGCLSGCLSVIPRPRPTAYHD